MSVTVVVLTVKTCCTHTKSFLLQLKLLIRKNSYELIYADLVTLIQVQTDSCYRRVNNITQVTRIKNRKLET